MRIGLPALTLTQPWPVASGGVTPYEGLAATRARMPTTTLATTNHIANVLTQHVATADISAIRIVPMPAFNIGTTGGGIEAATAASFTVEVGVEYPLGSTPTRITFPALYQSGGDPNVGAIPAGGLIISDMVTLATPIPAGATFRVRQYLVRSLTTSTAWPMIGLQQTGAVTVLDTGTTGNLSQSTTVPTHNAGARSIPTGAIIAETTAASVIVLGDSIGHGFGETETADGRGGSVCRSFPTDLAFLNFSASGRDCADWETYDTERSKLYPYCSHFVIELGHNDLITDSRSAATTQGLCETLIANLSAANDRAKFTLTTITHSSTSTDSWATTGNQTVNSTANSRRTTYNAAVRGGTIAGNDNGYFEIADALETARGSSIWKVTGAANGYTTDGRHLNDAGSGLIVSGGGVDHATKFTYP